MGMKKSSFTHKRRKKPIKVDMVLHKENVSGSYYTAATPMGVIDNYYSLWSQKKAY